MKQKVIDFLVERPLVLLLVSLVYWFSPIDLIPEGLLGPIGYLDDVLLLAFLVYVRSLMAAKRRRINHPGSIDTTAKDAKK